MDESWNEILNLSVLCDMGAVIGLLQCGAGCPCGEQGESKSVATPNAHQG
jgi:hypothetical protein